MKKIIFPLFAVAFLNATASLRASLITEPTRYFNIGHSLADLQDPPDIFEALVNDSAILMVTEVQVGLHLVGIESGLGFASEMFVSLNKDDATSILLNRVGVTATEETGFYYDGWNVTFSDSAANGDVHLAALDQGILTGAWQPDGRADGAGINRSQMLDVFEGAAGNGAWRLAVADLEMGGQMRLESWSLTLTGETTAAVPEAGTVCSSALLAALGLRFVLRRRACKA